MSEVKCFCGSSTSLQSNSLIYNGKEYGNGKIWLCDRFPSCRGSVGTHPDGRPLGTIPDEETKKLRIKVHAMIDPIWKSSQSSYRYQKKLRGSVYGWLKRIMNSNKEIHVGETTKEDCIKLMEAIKNNPFEVKPQENKK